MPRVVSFYNWWVFDERTGERRLTAYKLTRVDADRAFPGAEPDPRTREVRSLPDPVDLPADSRPGQKWSWASEGFET
jgi:hypothetical protein